MRKQLLILGLSLLCITGLRAQQTYVDEDFNNGSLPTGWSTSTISGTANWQFGFDGSSTEPNINRANNIDSTDFAYFDDDNLGFVTNNTAVLSTPTFDNTLAGTTTLRFDYNFRDWNGTSVDDELRVEVYDGTNWVSVFSTSGADDCGRYAGTPGPPPPPASGDCRNGFPSASVDISLYANANCQVRFVYDDGNDQSWYAGIDNVIISAPVDDDIRVAEIVDPLAVACGLDVNHLPIIKLKNEGTARATGFDLTFDVDGGTQSITETVTDTIDGGDSLLFQFSTSVDLSATTNFDILVYSTWAADAITTNDTVRKRVSNEPSFAAPYADGFEVSPGDWTTSKRSGAFYKNSWDKGFPSGSVISFANQGNEAWVTNLFGAYLNNEESYLVSPCFDFSTSLGDPNVAFDLFYDVEGFDSLVLQSSIDNGATWKTVPKTVIERNWYNASRNGSDYWSGRSGNWIRAENILTGLAGEGQVKLRFKFKSDGAVSTQLGPQEGVGIDAFRIDFPKAVDLGIQRLFYPVPGDAPDCGYSLENISVRLENRGATEVDTFFISARVDNQQIVRDTVIQNFPINTVSTYTFKNQVNFTGNPTNNYTLNVWVTAVGDGSSRNDSLKNIRITNTNPPLYTSPVKENFDANLFTAGTVPGNTNSAINNQWTRSAGATWQVANSNANLPPTSGPASDHTGNNGNFIYTDASTAVADDIISIETPCLDFTDKDSLTMEFWYYGFGGPYFDGLRIDVFDGTEWVNDVDIITSFPQNSINSQWSFYNIRLDQFAGARIKVRFSLDVLFGPSPRSIIAIDDLVIFEPIPQDAEMISINAPVSNCALNANSLVEVTVNNFGLDLIPADSLTLVYQVITGVDTTTVREQVPQSILQRTSIDYTFATTADLSKPGQAYEIRAWSELFGDSNFGNDTILDYEVTNFTRDPGYIEPFTSFDFLDGDCLAANLDQIGRGWTASNTQYTWNMQEARICRGNNGATPTFGTGPENDHSTNVGDGKFFYTESTLGARFDEAELTSPCLDFTGRTGVSLAFWYHKFGSAMGDLYIDVLANGIWTLGVDTVIGETQTSTTDEWRLKAVNLSQFSDNLIQIRFRGVKSSTVDRGDMAIDDIEFYEPIPQDARVSRVITPVTECSPAGAVEVVVENFGTDPILPNTVVVNYAVNGNSPLSDTLPVGIPVGGSVNHVFTVLGSFTSPNTQYLINSWSRLRNDSNVFNDSVSYSFTNLTQSIQYKENFEAFLDGNCVPGAGEGDGLIRGWVADPGSGNAFHWNVQNAGACFGAGNANTGPRTDATRGGGQFMYVSANQAGSSAELYLPCVDFSNYASAGMTFSYHMFGNQIDTLYVDVYNDLTGIWDNVYKLGGQQQTSKFDPWREGAAKFEEFAGLELQIRFRAGRGGSNGIIAIDDVGFYLPQPIDGRMNAVIAPVAGCEIFEQSIIGVEFENFGTDTIEDGSLQLFYQVDDEAPVGELYSGDVLIDEVVTYFFNTTADLSNLGATYNIKAWTSATGEGNVDNDTLFTYTVINETKRTNYFENFELFKDAQCVAALGQVTANGWTVESTDGYTWHVQSSKCRDGNKATFTSNTGPEGDHTTGDGIFLYADAGDNNPNGESKVNGTAIFLSPCIDLQPNTNVRMSFWFHRYGNNSGNMFVDVFADGVWNLGQNISVNGNTSANLSGQTQNSSKDAWSKAIVDLDAYAGKRVLIRFRAEPLSSAGFRGDIAIDDIFLYEPSTTDIAVTEIISPDADLCQVDNDYDVQIRLENVGLNAIDSVYLTYSNVVSTSRDTLRIRINPGETRLYTFSEPFDLTLRSGVQDFRVTASVVGDTITENNSIRKELNNRQPSLPRYFMDFENHGAGDLQGWRNSPGAGYSWNVVCGPAPWIDGMMPNPPQPAPPSGPSGDHTFATTLQNGEGCYMMINSNIVPIPITLPDALLELPCGEMDFSNSSQNEILLTFWYHMYGANMGDLYVDVHDGTTWRNRIDVIRGPLGQMNDDTDRWKRKQVSLSQFAGLSKVKVRFRAEWLTRGGDMAIDDVEILDRAKNDANMVRIIDPESDCDLTNTERFRVQFQNTGTEDILESILCYQLTFTPYKGVAEVKPTVCDTAVGISGFVAPLAFQTFEFDRIDMSLPGTYEFKVWTKMAGDNYFFNDTIIETVVNETRPFPNCEDFSDMVFGQIAKDYRDGKLPNGWVGTTAGYGFKVSIGGNGGGPAVGHTGRNNDAYLLLDDADGMPGQVASVESPCYDLTNTPAANLEFWYQAPSENHFIQIEARNTGGQWQVMDTLFPAGGAGGAYLWTKATIVMTEFVGDFAQVRFTGVNAGDGFFALDDFCMVRPPTQEIELERFTTPRGGLCFYSNAEPVTLRVQNIGRDRITSFQVVLAVDSAFQNFPVGKYLRDTVTININSNPFFDPGVKRDIVLNLPNFLVDMSARSQFFFSAYVLLPGDTDPSDNLIEDYTVFHPTPIRLPYVEDFEFVKGQGTRGTYTNGIRQLVGGSGFYVWTTRVGLNLPKSGLTGPATDHTKGQPDDGVYMVTNSDALQAGDIAVLETRCIDLSNAINPEMRYWYYMFGFQMGDLYVEINDDNGWVRIDELFGEDRDQNKGSYEEWKSRTISLQAYAGKFVKLRFWSTRGDGDAGDCAIDDIAVYDLAAKDLAAFNLAEPNADTNSCYTENQQIRVNLRNNGSDSINFPVDSTFIQVIVFKEDNNGIFVQIDSLTKLVTANTWLDQDGNPKPLPPDTITTVLLDGTFDMSDTGKLYKFVVNIQTKGDVITRNDQYTVNVLSQRIGGEIFGATPNDTICFGDQVRVRVRNRFGAVRWEEKLSNRDGQDFWFPGLEFPFDSAYYTSIPDSTTKYRVRICNSTVISDSLEVVVIKPFVPEGLSAARCDSGFMTVRARVEDNITRVRMWDSLRGGELIASRPVPFGYSQEYLKTDTFYLEGIIETRNVRQGFCASINRDTVFATVNFLPDPILVDTNLVPPCNFPLNQGVCRSGLDSIFVCQDSSFVLDGGRVTGRQDNYEWTIINPDGSITNSSNAGDSSSLLQNQTLVVDAWLLELNQVYAYTVIVTSDSGCVNKMPYDTVYVTVSDSCITSIEEISFKGSFNIYPNPVSNELYVKHQSIESFKGTIRLMTVEGQLIQEVENLDFRDLNHKFDMGTLPKGIYIIKVETERGSFVEKVIKS